MCLITALGGPGERLGSNTRTCKHRMAIYGQCSEGKGGVLCWGVGYQDQDHLSWEVMSKLASPSEAQSPPVASPHLLNFQSADSFVLPALGGRSCFGSLGTPDSSLHLLSGKNRGAFCLRVAL